ncbi:MAG: LytTR family DNA-binding domain-containing protein [Bacteroidota bacterium]
MIRCVAIDDEPKALEIINNHISRTDFLTLEGTFTNPFKAASFINDQEIELVFLDINMPDINGMKLIKNFNKSPLIIFTTAHSEYAIQSYEVEAVDYLLKPFDFARFLLAVTKAKEKLISDSISRQNFFFVNTGNRQQRLFYNDIYYIEGEGNYVNYVTKSEQLLVRSSIKDTLKILPASKFVQIHRSFIVALQWIEKIEDNHVFVNEKRISISNTFRSAFLNLIKEL